VQQRLSEEVRNLVLVSEIGQTFARQQGEAGLLESMTRSARILFDFENAAVLLENPTGHALVGAPATSSSASPNSRSRCRKAARGRSGAGAAPGLRAAARGDARPAEEQLLRMLGTESLVCVPLVAARAAWAC
jgi:hypothetical protein